MQSVTGEGDRDITFYVTLPFLVPQVKFNKVTLNSLTGTVTETETLIFNLTYK